ncbi:aldo/keto reductase [Acidiplasma sp.]|uniref:aldo/keto reductase n=1 Tax=Acidiplasma sp. TaxID=1872114 RepID=UPI00258B1027|nr:aldo/keto reductase [Acidiplasma sp.]
MIYRDFGTSGFKASAIGMGTYYDMRWIFKTYAGVYSNKKTKINAIKTGLENGINLIDTAEFYHTEGIVSEAVKNFKRDEIFISTKVLPTHLSPKSLERALKRSLKNLNMDYVDLYIIHFPNYAVDLKKTLKKMEELTEAGLIRNIGVSNFSFKLIKYTVENLKKYNLCAVQLNYNILHRNVENNILDYLKKNNIALMAYFPIAHGKTARNKNLEEKFNYIRSKIGDVPSTSIALSYLTSISDNVFPIPRASNPEHVMQNIKYADIKLNDELIKYIQNNF